jgi:phosphatidate cytidylyltransferase
VSRRSGAGLPADLGTRAAVGLALAIVAVAVIWLGGIAYWITCAAVGLGMMWEWCVLLGLGAAQTRLAQLALVIPLAIMAPLAAGPGFLALGLIGGAALFVLATTRQPMAAAGIIYTGLPILGLVLIRHQPMGAVFAFWTLALVWMCDIGAYFTGRAIGGARLAPVVSPNKTWAGLFGGILAAAAFGAVMHVCAGLPWRLTLATPVLAALAQGGDLFESWLKRRAGVKDSGALLPGHGGLLDRLDGLAPVAPVAAFLVMLPEFRGFFG